MDKIESKLNQVGQKWTYLESNWTKHDKFGRNKTKLKKLEVNFGRNRTKWNTFEGYWTNLIEI